MSCRRMTAICPVCDLVFLPSQRTCFMMCCAVAVHDGCTWKCTSREYCVSCNASGDTVKIAHGVWYAPKKGHRQLTRIQDNKTACKMEEAGAANNSSNKHT